MKQPVKLKLAPEYTHIYACRMKERLEHGCGSNFCSFTFCCPEWLYLTLNAPIELYFKAGFSMILYAPPSLSTLDLDKKGAVRFNLVKIASPTILQRFYPHNSYRRIRICTQLKKIAFLMNMHNLVANQLLCIISHTIKWRFSWEICLCTFSKYILKFISVLKWTIKYYL